MENETTPTEKETLLLKLSQMKIERKDNLIAMELGELKASFIRVYLRLVLDFMGVGEDQLVNLSRRQHYELAEIIFKRAKPWAILQMVSAPILFFIPLFGQLALVAMFYNNDGEAQSFYYCMLRRKLIKISGPENYFPYLLFQTMINSLNIQ